MKKSFIIALIALLAVGSAVGLGIHILHRDARAEVVYVIYCDDGVDPVLDLGMQFQFDWNNDGDFLDPGEEWVNSTSEGLGWYKCAVWGWSSGSWQTRITDPDWVFVDTGTPVSELFAGSVNQQEEQVLEVP